MAATDTTRSTNDELTPDEQTKLETALFLLRDAGHPQVKALHSKIDSIAHPVGGESGALAKMDGVVAELQKADATLTRSQALEKARRERPDVAREVASATRRVSLDDDRRWGVGRQTPPAAGAREGVTGEHPVGSALDEFRAAVDAHVSKGLPRSEAQQRVRRERPDLEHRIAREEGSSAAA